MSEIQNNAYSIEGESASFEPSPDGHSGSDLLSGSQARGALGMDDIAASGGQALLSRPSAQHGRRSLFRR